MADEKDQHDSPYFHPKPYGSGVTRRQFLAVAAAGAAAAAAAALSPLKDLTQIPTLRQFLQKHYTELTPEEKKEILGRISAEVREKYGVTPHLTAQPPLDGVQFAYALNMGRCIGCRKCVYACVNENNQSRDPQIHYISVLEMEKGAVNVETSNTDYEGQVPKKGHYYMPVQCHHCEKPPCTKVCPVKATWREPDGIVVVDYNWCIGCRYCAAACPYHARRFNFKEPYLPKEDLNPEMGYLSNRPRQVGVMEKCTFCLHRTRAGKYPACLEVCPTGSRKFGNLLDPDSEIAAIIRDKRVFILKQERGTIPRFYYFTDV
ncbi:MAG: 4Fe-4S dicluster domain-containing protein [Elusimicrobiota bacterium]|nr:4Fe-4S dicluster domain-containing protein [Elusimicrobiota bacterium]